MTRLQKSTTRGYFAHGQGRIATVAQKPVGALQAYPHQFVTERGVGVREEVVQITLGDSMGVRDRARSQSRFVAAITNGAANSAEKLVAGAGDLGIRAGGERQEGGDLLRDDAFG